MLKEVQGCIGRIPIFGICLGHQLLGLAFGGSTFKLKFGHRGANQPVLDLRTHQVEITAQNHGFAVDEGSLPPEIEVTHRHLSDGTVEGLAHRSLPIFSLQHHPEASPGPHDARGAFGRFYRMMESHHA
jgi:carbamoyl-phosphate synthase small subunit